MKQRGWGNGYVLRSLTCAAFWAFASAAAAFLAAAAALFLPAVLAVAGPAAGASAAMPPGESDRPVGLTPLTVALEGPL